MPYIYSESAKVTIDDAILMKPLMHDYPQDSCCWDIKDQFFIRFFINGMSCGKKRA